MRLNYKDIRSLVKKPYLNSGRDYFNCGKVRIVSIDNSHVKSEVMGSSTYQVTLRHNGQYLSGRCTCSAYRNIGPCKHMAATGFALIQLDRQKYRLSSEYSDYVDEQARLEKLLAKEVKQDLILIITRLSNDHPEILEELEDKEYEEYKQRHSR